jgi:hypothetical protein
VAFELRTSLARQALHHLNHALFCLRLFLGAGVLALELRAFTLTYFLFYIICVCVYEGFFFFYSYVHTMFGSFEGFFKIGP